MHTSRHALVTGGSAGIGRELALQLAAAGDRVLICGRDRARLDDTVATGGGRIRAVVCDIARADGRATLVEAAQALGAPLDLLVHNAGVQFEARFGEATVSPEAVEREIAINLTAPLALTAALMPQLRRPGATVINVTSLLARHPKVAAPVYCATKAGLRAFSQALRHQLAPLGLHVIEAVPPLVDTAMTAGRGRRKISPTEAARQIVAGLPRRRAEIHIGVARALCTLDRLAPSLVARALRGR
jgi:uncharacterized oxidoreductase